MGQYLRQKIRWFRRLHCHWIESRIAQCLPSGASVRILSTSSNLSIISTAVSWSLLWFTSSPSVFPKVCWTCSCLTNVFRISSSCEFKSWTWDLSRLISFWSSEIDTVWSDSMDLPSDVVKKNRLRKKIIGLMILCLLALHCLLDVRLNWTGSLMD